MKGGFLVKTKDGLPKFDDPKHIKRFQHVFTDEQWEKLHEKWGDEWIDKDNKKVRK